MAPPGRSLISLADIQRAGFPMGGENLAVDLADTVVLIGDTQTDLLDSEAASDRFWKAHEAWLPNGWASPTLERTRRLRAAIRSVLDAIVVGAEPSFTDVTSLNETSALANVHYELSRRGNEFVRIDRWHAHDATNLSLAAAASSAIDFSSSSSVTALRRCASPTCSMLFFTGDARRRWCTPNICGNRDRAARHYRRRRKI